MTAERVTANIATVVLMTLEHGQWPFHVQLSVASYRALVARDGLEPRRIGATKSDTLRVRVHGFDLPADCHRGVGDDDAYVTARILTPAQA
jgi:hypothetical protein